MMITIEVLDKNLDAIGMIEMYNSLIWSNRYWDIGDCELYLPATQDNLDLLKMGYYLRRYDDDMVCQIRKIEVDTDVENGNYLIVTGIDTKAMLDQRVYFNTAYFGDAERMMRLMTIYVTSYNLVPRRTPFKKENGEQLIKAGEYNGFTDRLDSQRRFFNVGELWREVCHRFNWGYRFRLDGGQLAFEFYTGADKSHYISFSPEYENLAASKYVHDRTHMGNAAVIAGAGQGADRLYVVAGEASGADRFEIYVDARDLQREVTYADVMTAYSNGAIRGDEVAGYTYYVPYFDVMVTDEVQLARLRMDYLNGIVIVIDGKRYFRVYDIDIADLPTNEPTDETAAVWRKIVYDSYLASRGLDKLAEYGETKIFEGSVIPDVTFKYKEDYFLGDLVTVENELGISAIACIVEVVEVDDDNGYRLEPKFEYIQGVEE